MDTRAHPDSPNEDAGTPEVASATADPPDNVREEYFRSQQLLLEHQIELEMQNQELRRAEQELSASRNRYARLFHRAPIGNVVLDRNGQIREANETFCTMVGIENSKLLGTAFASFLDLGDRHAFLSRFRALYQQPDGKEMAARLHTCGGNLLEVHLVCASLESAPPTRDEDLPRLLLTISDVTQRRRAEEQQRLVASVFAASQEGILIADARNRVLDINPAFITITGYAREEVIGRNPRILQSGHHKPEFFRAMWETLSLTGQWRGEIWNRRKSGEVFPAFLSISAVHDPAGDLTHYVGVFSDITPQKEQEWELARIAHYDALTGLPNRRLLSDRLAQGMAHTRRSQTLMAVCYLDLDGFKAVNDLLGHEAGDVLLRELARRLDACVRGGDTVARLGGDEFVVVMLNLHSISECQQALSRILLAVAQPVEFGHATTEVSGSMGVILYPQDDCDPDTLLRHADQAMYVAKESGKNRYHLYDPDHDRQLRAHRDALARLEQAFAENEFMLYFQPKVNMCTGALVGAEALIRWQHPERGLLLPEFFLPTLMGSPLEIAISRWVIRHALEQVARWHDAGLSVPVSVNLSANHLMYAGFSIWLAQTLSEIPGVSGADLELEVLESVAIDNVRKSLEIIEACRSLSVTFALDDFGTGYSSLTYFRRLSIDTLKIDREFVRDMLSDPDDLSIVESVIRLTEAFQRHVIAEGVESAQHAEVLVRLGCPIGQGFGIGRPMPAEDFAAWLAAWNSGGFWRNAQPPLLARDDVALVVAEQGHLDWIAKVAALLDHGAHQGPPPLDAHDCSFGRWYGGPGRHRYGHLPAYRAIAPAHDELHAIAERLVAALREGRNDEARSWLGPLGIAGEALRNQLRALIAELSGSEP